MQDDILAVDFGTSNTAAACLSPSGGLHRIRVESAGDTLPTAVFFPANGGAMRIGEAASKALTSGEEGRYMRALKSVLGTELLHDSRLIAKRRRSLAEVITEFLVELRRRASAEAGRPFTRVLSGRPVHFHTADAERDAAAEADLRACYLAAGFEEVRFMYEPEAAALATHGLGRPGDTGLIVDIGGGTSDFSVFRTDAGRLDILGSHGIRLGGTNFDHVVSLAHAMPLLGYGGELRREFGPGTTPVPHQVFVDLARWEKIPFLYAPDTRRLVKEMAALAVEPEKLGRLRAVLEEELGHDLAFAVEAGKIAANRQGEATRISMEVIEPGLTAPIDPGSLDAALDGFGPKIAEAAATTLKLAGVRAEDIGRVVLVGGSSLMALVPREMQALCPNARIDRSEAFTAVVDGLALATARP